LRFTTISTGFPGSTSDGADTNTKCPGAVNSTSLTVMWTARFLQGCFETAEAAKAYIKKLSHERPERRYKFEECKHREHQH
jgi:hypothetical protein